MDVPALSVCRYQLHVPTYAERDRESYSKLANNLTEEAEKSDTQVAVGEVHSCQNE